MYDSCMLFLVDGYNVTRSDPDTRRLGLEGQREALTARLRVRGRQLLGEGRIVVLFDAAEGAGVSSSDASPVTVLYSRAGSADDAIVRAVSGATGKVVVVTNDSGLVDRVRVHAAGEIEVRPSRVCFEAAVGVRSRRARRGGIARDVGLPSGANRITEELKDLWLKDDE